jgi:hypothetical protein
VYTALIAIVAVGLVYYLFQLIAIQFRLISRRHPYVPPLPRTVFISAPTAR